MSNIARLRREAIADRACGFSGALVLDDDLVAYIERANVAMRAAVSRALLPDLDYYDDWADELTAQWAADQDAALEARNAAMVDALAKMEAQGVREAIV